MNTFAGFAHPPEQNAKLLYNFFWEGLLLMEVYSYQWSGPKYPCKDPDTLHFLVQKIFFVFIHVLELSIEAVSGLHIS